MTQMDEPADIAASDTGKVAEPVGLSRQLLVIGGLGLVALVAVLAVVFGGDDGGSVDAPAALNEFVFLNEDGSEGTLADFEGQPTVVNFYASWCAPCRAELPHFKDVQAEAGDTVRFVGVNHDLDETSWRSFNQEFELNYPTVFQQNQQIFTELELLGMPSTTFINADGEIVHSFTGVLNGASLKDLIAEHLAVEI